jgi:hypothetical protein
MARAETVKWILRVGWLSLLAAAASLLILAPPAHAARPQESGTYTEGFEDPVGADLTIDGPGGLSSQPCPEGASQSAADCARGRRRAVDGPVCPFDEQYATSLTGVRLENNDWHVHTSNTPDLSDSGKARHGQNSLHWGRHVVIDERRGTRADTYVLETINTFEGPDLNLAVRGDSEMSFWHIAEFCDTDCWAFLPDTGDDYSIVEVRADMDPSPDATSWTLWERVSPHFGAYDGMQDTLYSSPTFDPGDDINPEDPDNPSITMCLPNTVFLSQGSARGTDAACGDGDGNGFPDCGHGPLEDDPALRTSDRVSTGETGVGVWVQSKINLARYAGRHIQFRFVATTLDDSLDTFISYAENYDKHGPPAIPADLDIDDGWYIDSISVTNTVPQEPARRGRRR